MVSHLSYSKNGDSEIHSYKHYVYTIGEIQRLRGSHGLSIIALYNNYKKEPYTLGDQQLNLVCEKDTR